jgi:hypothetical protein
MPTGDGGIVYPGAVLLKKSLPFDGTVQWFASKVVLLTSTFEARAF